MIYRFRPVLAPAVIPSCSNGDIILGCYIGLRELYGIRLVSTMDDLGGWIVALQVELQRTIGCLLSRILLIRLLALSIPPFQVVHQEFRDSL